MLGVILFLRIRSANGHNYDHNSFLTIYLTVQL